MSKPWPRYAVHRCLPGPGEAFLVPWPLAVLTKYQPSYWTEDPVGRSYHYIHNLAQLTRGRQGPARFAR